MTEQPASREKHPESLESYRERALANGWQSYVRKRPRSLVPYRKGFGAKPLLVRGVQWILPWSISDYPGKLRGSVEVFNGKWALETILSWQKGYRQLPAEAAMMLAAAIKARCEAGAVLIAELETYAAERVNRPKSGLGFRKVDPVTGLDKRSRVGRKRTKEL